MAEASYPIDTLPSYIDNECYSAQELRQLDNTLVCLEGVKGFAQVRVTESAVPAMSVLVSAGSLWVGNDEGTCEGPYHFRPCTAVTVGIDANTSGSTRYDTIWARVCDAQYSAEGSGGTIYYDPGGATSTDPATATVPTDDCSYYLLAIVRVTNGETAINGTPNDYGLTETDITDTRNQYQLCAAGGFMYYETGPSSQTDYTAEATAVTLTAVFDSGRRYRVTGYVDGSQITNPGVGYAHIQLDGADFTQDAYLHPLSSMFSIAAGGAQRGQGSTTFTTTDGSHTLTLRIFCSAASLRVAANQASLTLEDIGPA